MLRRYPLRYPASASISIGIYSSGRMDSGTASEVTPIQVSVVWLVYISTLLSADPTPVTTTVLNGVVGTVGVFLTTSVTLVLIVVYVLVIMMTEVGQFTPWLHDTNAATKTGDISSVSKPLISVPNDEIWSVKLSSAATACLVPSTTLYILVVK